MTGRRMAAGAAWMVAVTAGWMVSGCAGFDSGAVPPSELKPPIDHPSDHRIFFRTEELRHVVTLHDDGSYLFRSGSDTEGVVSTRDGRWSWKKTGTHQAELTLDRDVWALRFAGIDSAFAVNQAAPGRTYVFEFEKL